MIKRVYGRVGEIRHRSNVVEYPPLAPQDDSAMDAAESVIEEDRYGSLTYGAVGESASGRLFAHALI